MTRQEKVKLLQDYKAGKVGRKNKVVAAFYPAASDDLLTCVIYANAANDPTGLFKPLSNLFEQLATAGEVVATVKQFEAANAFLIANTIGHMVASGFNIHSHH